MQRGFSIPIFALLCFTVTLFLSAPDATAGQTEREAALFIRSAFDSSSPFSYWHGGGDNSPTIFFYLKHRAWHEGSDMMRREGTKLLSCVASLLSTSLNDSAKPISTLSKHPHRYRILINPLPPGGGTQLAAEGLAKSGVCPKGHEQELILRLLVSKANPHAF